MQGKLIIFSAPSGSGKTTIVQHLLQKIPGLAFSISATSRPPRKNEKDGIDYYFLDPESFKSRIEHNDFLEWEQVYANQYYGTLRSEVDNLRKKGKHVLFDIDVVGGTKLKKEFKDDALAIFVQPPSLEIMEQRLRARASDSEEQLRTRINKAKEELGYANKFDLILVNDVLEHTLEKAENIVNEFIAKEGRV